MKLFSLMIMKNDIIRLQMLEDLKIRRRMSLLIDRYL